MPCSLVLTFIGILLDTTAGDSALARAVQPRPSIATATIRSRATCSGRSRRPAVDFDDRTESVAHYPDADWQVTDSSCRDRGPTARVSLAASREVDLGLSRATLIAP